MKIKERFLQQVANGPIFLCAAPTRSVADSCGEGFADPVTKGGDHQQFYHLVR
jgi:hypothetical protein